jgi:hypothetical protein
MSTAPYKCSYCVVFDTLIEDMLNEMFPNRRWGMATIPKRRFGSNSKRNLNSRSTEHTAKISDYRGVRRIFEMGTLAAPARRSDRDWIEIPLHVRLCELPACLSC